MPEPQAHPNLPQIQRVALNALIAGFAIMAIKFGIFAYTESAAVLSDALESIINLVAAAFMLYSIWLSNRPADRDHPYGHGKVEFMTIGLEGWLILLAGLIVGYEGIRRLVFGHAFNLGRLEVGGWLLLGVGLLSSVLGVYVWLSGRKYGSAPLAADGRHLLTDAASTLGVFAGLWLVRWSGKLWLDPLVAIVMAALILFTSWKLLWHSIDGLMDKADPADDAAVHAILDEEVAAGVIKGYHKVRLRHTGPFHWVDLHLQVDGSMNVAQSHELASRIEKRIEDKLGEADATAHVEPFIPEKSGA